MRYQVFEADSPDVLESFDSLADARRFILEYPDRERGEPWRYLSIYDVDKGELNYTSDAGVTWRKIR